MDNRNNERFYYRESGNVKKKIVKELILFLDNAKGVDPPVEYIEMCYRREFGITHKELMAMPYSVFLADIKMINTEKAIKNNVRKK